MAEKTIYLHGEFGSDITSDVVIPQIDAAISEKVSILTFDISSFGGSVKTGREIMGAIERAKLAGITIATQCLSFAYSMGANLFLMGSKGHRKLSEHAELMFHPVMGSAEGNATEMMQVVTSLQEMSDNLLSYITKGNEANADKIKSAFESAKMIGADEAISLGLADGYVEKLKAVAYYSKNNDMDHNEVKKEITGIKGLIAKIVDMITPKNEIVNSSATAEDGSTIYYEGSLETGTKCFSDEAMTNALADGTYVIAGTSYTVSGGEITSESASDSAEITELKNKVQELTEQIENEKAEKVKIENEKTEELNKVKTEFEAVVNKVTDLEKRIVGEDGRHQEEPTEKSKYQIEKENFFASFDMARAAKN